MSATPWLWSEIHDFFDTDDGSLPEIRIGFTDTRALASGYALLHRLALTTSPGSPSPESIPDDANPAALVVSGEAEPFHVVFGGIKVREAVIPDLGVFVFPDELALDYRMGAAWGAAEVEGFFALLSELLALDRQASISLGDGISTEAAARFHEAWRRYSINVA